MGGRWRGVKRALSIQRTTNYGLEYIRYQAAKTWNSLPDSMRTITSFKDYKSVKKKMNFSSSYNHCISSTVNYYLTALCKVQMTPKTSTNITRHVRM